jgi:site-specific DNA-methyltransferase (adenine-specific)
MKKIMKSEKLKEAKLLQNGKARSEKNKTLSLSPSEVKKYDGLYLTINDDLSSKLVIENNVILGDSFEVIKKLPDNSIDLLVVDPPYNLSKTYAAKNFNRMSDGDYEK